MTKLLIQRLLLLITFKYSNIQQRQLFFLPQLQFVLSESIFTCKMLRIIVLLATCSLIYGTLIITTPLVTDFKDNTIDYYYANFGEIPYGKTMSYDVVVLNSSLCTLPDDQQHFQKPTYIVVKTTLSQSCTYTKKALNAQAIGAKGILISSSIADYNEGAVIQTDDGNGRKVHITCLFINVRSYDKLSGLNKIQIIANFPVPQEEISTVTLYLSASNRKSYNFLREFKPEYVQLKSKINLQVLYHTVQCLFCGQQNCYLTDYCTFDYQYQQMQVGQKIIRQQLHQTAIFTQRGAQKWFTYMDYFDQYCDGDWYDLDDCSKKILKKMNMDDAYNVDPVTTLGNWRSKQILLGFDSFPQIAINGIVHEGNLEMSDIVDTICASIKSPPKYCTTRTIEPEVAQVNTNDHVLIIIFATIFALMVVVAVGMLLYRKFIRNQLTKDMTSKVDEIVAHYASKLTSQKKRQREKLVETFDQEL